jgi:prepilin-type N-terminal cleavage/methylation domain-containing protein
MKTRRGFTLVEMTTVMMIMTMLVVGSAALLSTTIRSFTHTSNQFDADMSATISLQIVNRDLQEAKQVAILTDSKVRVYYPKLEADGTYNRTILDTATYIDFFRGKENGSEDPNGKCLVRRQANGEFRVICDDVIDLEFRTLSPSSVDITLKTEEKTDTVVRRCEMVHRAIFLRNY